MHLRRATAAVLEAEREGGERRSSAREQPAQREHTTRQRTVWAGLKRHQDTARRHRREGRRREAGAVRAESCGRQAQRRF
jgi:hypothetical protein